MRWGRVNCFEGKNRTYAVDVGGGVILLVTRNNWGAQAKPCDQLL